VIASGVASFAALANGSANPAGAISTARSTLRRDQRASIEPVPE
jgi:hypothetical protein